MPEGLRTFEPGSSSSSSLSLVLGDEDDGPIVFGLQ